MQGTVSPEQPALFVSLGRFVLARYDRRSAVALVLLLGVGGLVGYRWSDLLDANQELDGLLAVIWLCLTALICWNVDSRRDLLLVAVGVGGGGTIEWWGTTTRLWSYFTNERPPLWILPAWPAATLAIDRLGALLGQAGELIEERIGRRVSRGQERVLYFTLIPAFVAWMSSFLWPTIHLPASRVVVGLMVSVAAFTVEPRRDLSVFAAGTALGVLLEYWGTSRECWTYYTHQVPPPVAVVAHGFAAVAFTRVAIALERLLGWLTRLLPQTAVREPRRQ